MSGSLHAWYSLRDLEALGVRQAVLSGELPLVELTRLADLLRSPSGSVKASLRFRQRASGWLHAELHCDSVVELTCQRCLEAMSAPIEHTVDLALVESDAMQRHVPEGCEPVVLEGDRLNPAQLIEDELIICLPLVPKHARIEDCGSLARLVAETADAEREAP